MEILIVDDEPMAVNALISATDWSELGVTKVWSAGGISDAVSIIYDEDIRIVLCDIELRGENGLHLVQWIQNHRPDVKCIMITSHVNFEYTRKALQFQVVDYLSKPIDETQLKNAVRTAADRLNKASREKENGDDALLSRILSAPGEKEGISEKDYSEAYRGEVLPVFVTVSKWNENYDEEERKKVFLQMINSLQSEYLKGHRSGVYVKENTAFLCFPETGLEEEQVRQALEKFAQFCSYYYITAIQYSIEAKVPGKALRETYDGLWNAFQEQLSEKTENQVSATIIRYIETHIGDDISRRALADIVYMSPDHLARVFKKETGLVLSQYIIDKKMEAARELLKNPELSVTFIAASVGYSNISHFTEAFRKKYTQSPTDYRRGLNEPPR